MNEKVLKLYKDYIDLCSPYDNDLITDYFIKHIHNDYLENNLIKLPYPLYATWDITNLCNLRCVFCSASSKNFKGIIDDEKTIELAQKIIDIGVKNVSIRGGEPMIVKQLPDVVNLFVENGLFVEIVSNGTGFNDVFFEKIKNCNKEKIRIKISLDSPNEIENDKIRGKNSYANAIQSMENCQRLGWPFRVQMVVVNSNKDKIKEMYNLISNKGATSFGIYLVLPFGRGSKVDKVEIDENLLEQIVWIKKNEDKTNFEKFGLGLDDFRFFKHLYENKDINDNLSKKISILKCNGAKTRINIDENGDCYPCDLMKYPEFLMGNIIKDEFNEIWNSKASEKFNAINRFTKNKCKDCEYKICNTGCLAMSYESGDDVNSLIPNCEL